MDGSGQIRKYFRSTGCWLVAVLAIFAILGLLILMSRSGSLQLAWLPRPLPEAGSLVQTTTVTPAVTPGQAQIATLSATLTGPTPTPTSTTTPRPLRPIEANEDPIPVYYPTPEPWEGQGRVSILILGLDSGDWDSPGRAGPPRADTLLVLSVDPVAKTAGMLSIPRDLTVVIPGILNPNWINTAHRFGEIYDMPGGGPGLTMRTV